jgi:LPXTG-site transpeptidase (sortase) family protein
MPTLQTPRAVPRTPVAVATATASASIPAQSALAADAPLAVVDAGSAPMLVGGAITRLVISSIALDADVVPATLLERDGALTWDIPSFRVGHAQQTAGAGEVGNAVLLGHVTSIRSGNVFKDLALVRVDDEIEIFSDEQAMTYRVTNVGSVPRSDVSVVEATPTRSVTLITCTGVWSPRIWDYTERLVVRAELVQ